MNYLKKRKYILLFWLLDVWVNLCLMDQNDAAFVSLWTSHAGVELALHMLLLVSVSRSVNPPVTTDHRLIFSLMRRSFICRTFQAACATAQKLNLNEIIEFPLYEQGSRGEGQVIPQLRISWKLSLHHSDGPHCVFSRFVRQYISIKLQCCSC